MYQKVMGNYVRNVTFRAPQELLQMKNCESDDSIVSARRFGPECRADIIFVKKNYLTTILDPNITIYAKKNVNPDKTELATKWRKCAEMHKDFYAIYVNLTNIYTCVKMAQILPQYVYV